MLQPKSGVLPYYQAKIEECELVINDKAQDLRRLQAQRNALNAKGARIPILRGIWTITDRFYCVVRLLKEELQLLQEPGSYVGEVVKVMGKKKVLVKVSGRRITTQNAITKIVVVIGSS